MQKTDYNLQQILEQSWLRIHSTMEVSDQQCYRLLHDLKYGLQMDIYGSVLWIYWYRSAAPDETELQIFADFCIQKKLSYTLRHMINRGTGVGGLEKKDLFKSIHSPEQWTAQENSLFFQLRTATGFSPGLFLDQSENRKWVLKNSAEKNILNLFSYTGGFSVAAAKGQAHQVTTVDASLNFLNWSKDNFKLNSLDPEKHEFFVQDVLLFLIGSEKRNRKWDLIICDPPSFGRSKNTVWKIEKNIPELILKLWSCLTDQGQILFTCNYEKWSLSDLDQIFKKTLSSKKFQITQLPPTSFDFEVTPSTQNLTKGFFILKLDPK